MCQASMEESSELKTILGNYEAASRQTINFSKSSINVGSLVNEDKKEENKGILRVETEGDESMYISIFQRSLVVSKSNSLTL